MKICFTKFLFHWINLLLQKDINFLIFQVIEIDIIQKTSE